MGSVTVPEGAALSGPADGAQAAAAEGVPAALPTAQLLKTSAWKQESVRLPPCTGLCCAGLGGAEKGQKVPPGQALPPPSSPRWGFLEGC